MENKYYSYSSYILNWYTFTQPRAYFPAPAFPMLPKSVHLIKKSECEAACMYSHPSHDCDATAVQDKWRHKTVLWLHLHNLSCQLTLTLSWVLHKTNLAEQFYMLHYSSSQVAEFYKPSFVLCLLFMFNIYKNFAH